MLRKYGYIAALMLKRLDLSRRVQPIRLRFQQVEVLPWELSVHPGSYNRLMGG
jgi:hypothetical protein